MSSERSKSFTPRISSKPKYEKLQSNLYTPKGGFYSYYMNPSRSKLT